MRSGDCRAGVDTVSLVTMNLDRVHTALPDSVFQDSVQMDYFLGKMTVLLTLGGGSLSLTSNTLREGLRMPDAT